ncbi:FlhC family transcriptional regulator [Carnimonas bestiolae]|uniref:FlhC family transcriptional regulator n=1 Tax=Carnimonas bestiolae TaxID=3402172 RepID=UPI003F4AD45C
MTSHSADDDQLSAIHNHNIAYLMLARELIIKNKPLAMLQLGMDEPLADLVADMPIEQIVAISRTNRLICALALDETRLLEWRDKTPRHQEIYHAQRTLHMTDNRCSLPGRTHDSDPNQGPNASLIDQTREQTLAIEMIKLGARPSVILQSLNIPYARVARLYREMTGKPLPKGTLPFATDWFLQWRANIHSSVFLNYHRRLESLSMQCSTELLLSSYRHYLNWQEAPPAEALLSMTRAWTLLRFLESHLLQMTRCTRCGRLFVDYANAPQQSFRCGLCAPPSRAGHYKQGKTPHDRAATARIQTAPRGPAQAPQKKG